MSQRIKAPTEEGTRRARRSKRKGRRGQRVAADLISHWWTGESDHFVSTPGSGSIRWKRGVGKVAADIVQATEDFPDLPFSVEVKNHEDWNFLSIMKGAQEFWKWWEQCCRDALTTEKWPMLMFTKNHAPMFIAVPEFCFSPNVLLFSSKRPRIEMMKHPKVHMKVYNDDSVLKIPGIYQWVTIMQAELFFTNNPPASLFRYPRITLPTQYELATV